MAPNGAQIRAGRTPNTGFFFHPYASKHFPVTHFSVTSV